MQSNKRKFHPISFVCLGEARLGLAGTFVIMVVILALTQIFTDSPYTMYGLSALAIGAFLFMAYLTAYAVNTETIERQYWEASQAEFLVDSLLESILHEESPARERLLAHFLAVVQKQPHRYMKYFGGLGDELRGELITLCERQMADIKQQVENAKVMPSPGKLITSSFLSVPKSVTKKSFSYSALKKVLLILNGQPSPKI